MRKDAEPTIKKMPDQQTLEQFMQGVHGDKIEVIFNRESGEFEWISGKPSKEIPLGEPKTEYGIELRRL